MSELILVMMYPLGSTVLGLIVGLGLFAGGYRRGAWVLWGGALTWIWVWSMPVFADQVGYLLERRYEPMLVEDLPAAEAIVILGGGVSRGERGRNYPNLSRGTNRYWHGARLYHARRGGIVILTGGAAGTRAAVKTEAKYGYLMKFGNPNGPVQQ